MALNASLDAALKSAAPTVFCALQIELPGHTIRVLDGAGAISFGGNTFTGSDATYGVLSAVESIAEEVGTEAPRVRFVFLPTSNTAMAGITAPQVQGSPVRLWYGAVNPQTGLVIGEPELLFLGELDEAELSGGMNSRTLTFDVASAWDLLFDQNEGARMNDAFWQWLYPGDRGFQYVTGVQQKVYWGFNGPRTGSRNYYGGGAGGSGGCPSPDMPVTQADAGRSGPGERIPAGEVSVGAWVWSRHHVTGEWAAFKVVAAETIEAVERWTVRLSDRREIVVSPDHPFELASGWIRTDELKLGDQILGEEPGIVVSVEPRDIGPVVRLTVNEGHSFSLMGLSSHNKLKDEVSLW